MARRVGAETAAEVLSDHLAARETPFEAGAPVIVADDAGQTLVRTLGDLGCDIHHWQRRALPGNSPCAWPGPGPWAGACVRLPKGREALAMTLHAALASVRAGGPVFLYGGNDEGIRSADRALAELCDDVRTLETRRHSRIWAGRRNARAARGNLEDWAERVEMTLPDGPAEVISFPGLFAHGRLDPATALLAETLVGLRPKLRVLDFGCGAGTLLLAAARAIPRAVLHGLDADLLALEAARRNAPDATLHASFGLEALPTSLRFDLVLSNPPIHEGIASDTRVLERLAAGIGRHLSRRGELRLVTQHTVPVHRWLDAAFSELGVVSESRSFRVWSARGPGGARRSGTPRSAT